MSTNTTLVPHEDLSIDVVMQWTPETLRANIEREKALRSVIVEYFRAAMQEGHHYYRIDQGSKPALSKEGSLNICSLFKVVPSVDAPSETYHDDGHYTVRARCHILDRAGQIVATGDGMCTTRESKYAYRWVFDNNVPDDIDIASLKKRSGTGRNGRPYTQYQCPNQDLADSFNTVLKMADKRALVNATLKLPLVSELFTQDLDEQIADARSTRANEDTTRRNSRPAANKPKPEPKASDSFPKELRDLMSDLNRAGDDVKWTGKTFNEFFGVEGPNLSDNQIKELAAELSERLADLKNGSAAIEAQAA